MARETLRLVLTHRRFSNWTEDAGGRIRKTLTARLILREAAPGRRSKAIAGCWNRCAP